MDVFLRLGMENMQQAFIGRYATADREDDDSDDQRPEVKLFAVAEWMLFVGRFFTFRNTEQKQAAIAGVDQRVNALGNHRRASRDRRCGKFGRSDGEIGDDGRVNSFVRFRHRPGSDQFLDLVTQNRKRDLAAVRRAANHTVDAITRKTEDNFDTQFKRVSTMIPAAVSAISFSLRMV
jgi:hypothetical protein